MLICIVRGYFIVDDNQISYVNYINASFALIVPLIGVLKANPFFIQNMLSIWLKLAIPMYVILIAFFMHIKVSGFYLCPITILLLFFAEIPKRWKWFCVLCLIIFITNLDVRSNIFKYGAAFLCGLLVYYQHFFTRRRLYRLSLIFYLAPIILFVLAFMGSFNIFNMDEYIEGDYHSLGQDKQGELIEYDLKSDTRTPLYREVLYSAYINNYIVFGRTPARGNDTEIYTQFAPDKYSTGRDERSANEVAILNIFTWTGIVGVIIYSLIFFISIYLAINKSKNFYMKILGLYISFRWIVSWFEDYNKFDINNIILWLMLAMCFSNSFRYMTDEQFRFWVNGFFVKRQDNYFNKSLIN
jgi:hypothetical protein